MVFVHRRSCSGIVHDQDTQGDEQGIDEVEGWTAKTESAGVHDGSHSEAI